MALVTDSPTPPPAGPVASRWVTIRPAVRFAGHFVEMVAAMVVGMAVLGIPVDAIARAHGYDNLYHELPELGAVVMTAIMTGPMALWMAVRGHDRQMIGEMSAAMIVPTVVFIVAARMGVIEAGGIPMLTDPSMYLAMLGVMVLRWRIYAGLGHGGDHGSGHGAGHGAGHGGHGRQPLAAAQPAQG